MLSYSLHRSQKSIGLTHPLREPHHLIESILWSGTRRLKRHHQHRLLSSSNNINLLLLFSNINIECLQAFLNSSSVNHPWALLSANSTNPWALLSSSSINHPWALLNNNSANQSLFNNNPLLSKRPLRINFVNPLCSSRGPWKPQD